MRHWKDDEVVIGEVMKERQGQTSMGGNGMEMRMLEFEREMRMLIRAHAWRKTCC